MLGRLGSFVVMALIGLGLPSCEEYGDRIYTAHPYRPLQRCIEPSVAIGVVETGELASNCPASCSTLDGAIYVSKVCPPYPSRAVALSTESPDCAAAILLLDAKAYCDPAPPSPADAGDGDGGPDDAGAPTR